MLSKREIKDIQSLSHKKFREELKLFIAEGPKIVAELAKAIPGQLHKIFALKSWIDAHQQVLKDIEVEEVQAFELEKISQLQTPHEVLALVKQFPPQQSSVTGFALYLDTIQDPGNFGTIIRIADWFGIKTIICSEGCADRYNPKVVQATMASLARVSVYYDEGNSFFQSNQLPVYAAVLEGRSLYEERKTGEGILLIGNESKGIRPELLQYASHRITIPRKGSAESLNAAVATGIILSHLLN
jgi:TrmH family RNA methyltransferase